MAGGRNTPGTIMNQQPPIHIDGFRGEILYDEPMSQHTSLKIGGPADLFVRPVDIADLKCAVKFFQTHATPYMTIGGGYNMLVRDGGIRGAVIVLDQFRTMSWSENTLCYVESGNSNLEVVRFIQRNDMGGISFISGIPGTIGGALRMNAGAYGKSILNFVENIHLFRNGELVIIPQHAIRYSYRNLELEPGDIIIGASIRVTPTPVEETEQEITNDLLLRREKHNVGFPSAGSFFKNPSGGAAWKLIDAAGMRGHQQGDAQFAALHSNFLINRGAACAQDCLTLVAEVKEAVFKTSGVLLEEEVRIVGEDDLRC